MLWLGSPPDIDIGTVIEAMRSGDGVVDVHHLHLRQMQEPLLSAIFEQFVGECAIGCFSAGATSHDLAEPSIHLRLRISPRCASASALTSAQLGLPSLMPSSERTSSTEKPRLRARNMKRSRT